MAKFTNIRGTSEDHFRISLSGPTLYKGTADPSSSAPASLDGLPLNPGDLYIRTGNVSQGLFILGTGGDNDWNEFLETGTGGAIIGGDLTVQGDLDTFGDIILLNSDLGALVGNIGGMEIGDSSGTHPQWVWNNALSQWEASSNDGTESLHNAFIKNNLIVGGTVAGRLQAPNGLGTTPGIRFSDAGIGIYATSTTLGFSTNNTPRWTIDAAGNFLPAGAYNIGASGALAGNIYGTLFAGTDGASGTPTFTFDSDTTTGIFTPAVGVIALSSGGSEVVRVDATEMELQGTLKITDGTSWTIDNDGADSNKLKISYSTVDEVVITTSGEITVGDGSQVTPAYSFLTDDSIGMYFDGTDEIRFTVAVGSDHLVISPTAINAPGATVNFSKDLTTKEYVDLVSGGTWLEPVIVKDDTTYPDLSTAEADMNTTSVDGVTVADGDRILYTGFPVPPAGPPYNTIYVINGTPGAGATLDNVDSGFPASDGDTVYVIDGTSNNNVYSYTKDDTWSEISATSGFGGTLYFNYEVQTAAVSQTTFTLTGIRFAPTSDGARLLVYVNGVKQVFDAGSGGAYTETSETEVEFNIAPGSGKTVEFYAVGLATDDGILKREEQTGETGTPTITFTTITYVPTQDGLIVFLNGQKMIVDTNYTEATSTTIDWITPSLVSADVLEFYSSVPIVAGVDLQDISNVSPNDPNDNDQLVYSSTSGLWEYVPAGSIYGGNLYDDDLSGLTGLIDGINDTFQTTDVIVQSRTGGPGKLSYQHVFVNGVLQKEDGSGDYQVNFPNIIIFNVGSIPQSGDSIDVYQL